MKGTKLTAIKNIGWAIAIMVCLLATFIGLLFAAFTRYGGEQFRGGLRLGETAAAETAEEPVAAVQTATGELNMLPYTEDGGQAYLDSLTFLCDSSIVGLKDYGLLSGGINTTQVWATPSGSLPASNIANARIVYPNDGSQITAANAAMIARPKILIISLGNDALADTDKQSFIDNYKRLIRDIQSSSPETVIICLTLTSVTTDYNGIDGLTANLTTQAIGWLQQVCVDTGVYYCDSASVIRNLDGNLLSEYASANGKTLNSTGLYQILQYLRTHTAK